MYEPKYKINEWMKTEKGIFQIEKLEIELVRNRANPEIINKCVKYYSKHPNKYLMDAEIRGVVEIRDIVKR